MKEVLDNPGVEIEAEVPANFVVDALSHGTPRLHDLTAEQAAEVCALKANAQPPTEALRRAAARARRFRFIPE